MAIFRESEGLTHEGLVLSLREKNGYHDSDFYATVWNPITRTTSEIMYGTTRASTYNNWATVDASEEVQAAAEQARRDAIKDRKADQEAYIDAHAQAVVQLYQATKMEYVKGAQYEVFKGRNVKKGTVGTLFYVRESNYGFRVGIKDVNGNAHWTYGDNIRLVDSSVLLEKAKRWAMSLPYAPSPKVFCWFTLCQKVGVSYVDFNKKGVLS